MDLKETEILGADPSTHWYYLSKARAMRAMLRGFEPNCILDVGAGSGFFTRYLLDHTTAREAWCVDTGYATDYDATCAGKPIHFERSVSSTEADLLLMMDVLEHVDDDCGLLCEYVRRIRGDGRVLISVPSFQWLWSEHDEFLEHRRRYTLQQLEHLAARAGLRVIAGAYFFGLVLPIAAAARLPSLFRRVVARPPRSQLVRHNRLVNAALAKTCSIEVPLMQFNRLGGLTAFCLASVS